MMISMRLETPSRGAHHCASCASKQQHDHREKKRHWNYHHRCTFWETNKKERSSFFSLIYSSALYTHSFSVVINWSRTREKSVLAEQKLGLDTLNIKLEIFSSLLWRKLKTFARAFWRCCLRESFFALSFKEKESFLWFRIYYCCFIHHLITKGKRSREIFRFILSGKDVSAAAGWWRWFDEELDDSYASSWKEERFSLVRIKVFRAKQTPCFTLHHRIPRVLHNHRGFEQTFNQRCGIW